MGKYSVRAFAQGQAGLQPARADAAPYPSNWKYQRRGIGSLFHQAASTRERTEYEGKHTGGVGKGVEQIRLSHANRVMNIGGMDHVANRNGDLRILDTEHWGRAVEEYEQIIEYLHKVARVATMSSEICAQTLGQEFVNACAQGAGSYKAEAIPAALQAIDATPDLVRVLPKKGADYCKAYSKVMWLLKRTSVAFSGPVEEFSGKRKGHHSEETGGGKRSLKEAVE